MRSAIRSVCEVNGMVDIGGERTEQVKFFIIMMVMVMVMMVKTMKLIMNRPKL